MGICSSSLLIVYILSCFLKGFFLKRKKKKQARNVIENTKDRKLDCKYLVNKNAGLFCY